MTEKIANQKYVNILYSDFLDTHLEKLSASNFRSLEAYLVKTNKTYYMDEQSCIIYVTDKNEAVSVGLQFGLRKLKYFDGTESLPILLIKRKEKGRRVVIYDKTGEKTNTKKLKNQEYIEAEKHCLEKKEVIKRGILTKRELEKALEENKLKEISIIKRSYIDREELANYIKNRDK